jgi:hypothetical protein
MPGTYDIRVPERLICLEFGGEISVEDCLAMMDRVRSDQRYDPSFNCLVDNRALARPFSRAELEQVIPAVLQAFGGTAERPRIAILVGRDLDYGVSRMFQMLIGAFLDLNLRIFREPGEAAAWLAAKG